MKKKIYSTLILAAAALLFVPSAAQADTWDGTIPAANASATFGGGDGTSATPYLISTCADLAQLAANVNDGENYTGKYFKQTADFDLDGHEWTPIGSVPPTGVSLDDARLIYFAGNYNGDDHLIDHLYIHQKFFHGVGLFGYIKSPAVIGHIIFENVDIYSQAYNCNGTPGRYWGIGTAVGSASTDCIIEYIQVQCGVLDASVKNNYNYIGGVVGSFGLGDAGSVIRYCTNGAHINLNSYYARIAGICGSGGANSFITGCVNVGTISGNCNSGGITTVAGPMVDNSLNAGAVTNLKVSTGIASNQSKTTNSLNVSYIKGTNPCPTSAHGSSANNFYDKQMCPTTLTTINGTTAKLTQDLMGTALQSALGTDNWAYTDGLYPVPKQLVNTNVAKIAAVPVNLYGESSIFDTVDGVSADFTYATNSTENTPMGWMNTNPEIMTMEEGAAHFNNAGEDTLRCTFGCTTREIPISYLPVEVWTVDQWNNLATKLNAGGGAYTYTRYPNGVEGDTRTVNITKNAAGQTIQVMDNLDFENADVAVVTANFKGTLQGNGYTFSNFVIPNANAHRGLIAILAGGTIDHLNVCNVTANVTSQTNSTHGLGGIVGCTTGTVKGNITNCAVSGNLTGKQFVGGIIGIAEGTQYVNVENCCFVGKIAGTSQSASQAFAGGIIGKAAQAGTTIKNCLSGALLEGVAYSGGISGGGAGTVQNCLFVGQALSSGYNGSITPVLDASGLTNNFYDDQMATAKGYLSTTDVAGKAEGKLTSQLLGSAGAGLLGSGWTSIGANAYPVPTGMETTDVALTIAAPLNLYQETYSDAGTTKTYIETYDKVNAPYTFATSIGGKTVARTTSNVAFPLDDTGKGVIPIDGTGTADLTFSVGCPVKYLKVEYAYVPLEVWAPDDWTSLTTAANNGGGVYTYKKDGTGEDVTPYLYKNAVNTTPQTINVMADLDFNAATIDPLGRVAGTTDFRGILKGNNHTFSNFVIDVNGDDYGVGLIGTANSATIENLHICGATINGTSSWPYAGTGALVGYSSLTGTTYITNCTASALVTGSQCTGGLVGTGFAGAFNINNCSFVGKATATGASSYAGGIMGISQVGSTINNCMNGGLVSGARAGGILGGSTAATNVTNCLVVGQVVGASTRAAISYSAYTYLYNNYYDKQMCVAGFNDALSRCEGKKTLELLGTAGQTLLGTAWTSIDDGAYPVPTAISTTAVALINAAPLKLFDGDVTIDIDIDENNAPIEQTERIVETTEGINHECTYATTVNENAVTWNSTIPTMPFDGTGKAQPTGSGQGVITASVGCAVKYIAVPAYARIEVWSAAEWKNLVDIVNACEEKTLYEYTPTSGDKEGITQQSMILKHAQSQIVYVMDDIDFTDVTDLHPMGGKYVDISFNGDLLGRGKTFSNMTITPFQPSTDKTYSVNGVLGVVNACVIKDLNLCNVTVESDYAYRTGCLVAIALDGSVVSCCAASGVVIGPTGGNAVAGGLCGLTLASTIDQNAFTGKVTGAITGGLVGMLQQSSTVTNNVSAAQVSSKSFAGGIIGALMAMNTTIKNNLFVGQLLEATSTRKGSIYAYAQGTNVTQADNYYDKQMCTVGGIGNADKEGVAEGRITPRLLGDKLKTALGEKWTYTNGYYPVPTSVKTYTATQLASVPVRQFITADGLKDANADYTATNGSDRPYYKYQTTDAFKRPALLVNTTANGTEIENWASSNTSLVVDENTATADGNKYLASPVRPITEDGQATLTATLGCAARYVNVTIPALVEAKDGVAVTSMAVVASDYTVWPGGQITDATPKLAAGKEITYKRIFDVQDASGVAGNNTATLAMPFPVQSITTDDYDDMVTYVLRPASKANNTDGHFSMWYLKAGTSTDAVAADDGFRNARWMDDFTFKTDGSVATYKGGTAFDWTKTPVHLAFSTDYFDGRPVEFHYVNETTSPYAIPGTFDEANYTGGTPRYYYYRGNHSMADQELTNKGAYLLNPYTGFFELNTHAQTISAFEAYVQSFGSTQTRVAFAYGDEGGSTDITDETAATGTNQLTVWREGGNLFVRSTVAQTVAVVSTSGQTVAAWSLAEGETQSIQLPAAVYVVKGSRNGTVKVAM